MGEVRGKRLMARRIKDEMGLGISYTVAEQVVEKLLEIIVDEAGKGNFQLRGFGSFSLKKCGGFSRVSFGKEIKVPKRTKLSFKASVKQVS